MVDVVPNIREDPMVNAIERKKILLVSRVKERSDFTKGIMGWVHATQHDVIKACRVGFGFSSFVMGVVLATFSSLHSAL